MRTWIVKDSTSSEHQAYLIQAENPRDAVDEWWRAFQEKGQHDTAYLDAVPLRLSVEFVVPMPVS